MSAQNPHPAQSVGSISGFFEEGLRNRAGHLKIFVQKLKHPQFSPMHFS
jgi:hypothetical protein